MTSRLGSESFALVGVATIARDAAHMEGPVEVADLELVGLDLAGQSLVGQIDVKESPSLTSAGELRGLQPPPDSFPASSSFDIFMQAIAPANPSPTVTMYNTAPLQMVSTVAGMEAPVSSWPVSPSVTFLADTTPCIPLLPTLPLEACITSLSIVLSPAAVGGVSQLAAGAKSDRAMDDERQLTRLEGVLIGVSAVGAVVVLTSAGWYLRRLRADR